MSAPLCTEKKEQDVVCKAAIATAAGFQSASSSVPKDCAFSHADFEAASAAWRFNKRPLTDGMGGRIGFAYVDAFSSEASEAFGAEASEASTLPVATATVATATSTFVVEDDAAWAAMTCMS